MLLNGYTDIYRSKVQNMPNMSLHIKCKTVLFTAMKCHLSLISIVIIPHSIKDFNKELTF